MSQRRRFFPTTPVQTEPGRTVELSTRLHLVPELPPELPPEQPEPPPMALTWISWMAPGGVSAYTPDPDWPGDTLLSSYLVYEENDGRLVYMLRDPDDLRRGLLHLRFRGDGALQFVPRPEWPDVVEAGHVSTSPGREYDLPIVTPTWHCDEITWRAAGQPLPFQAVVLGAPLDAPIEWDIDIQGSGGEYVEGQDSTMVTTLRPDAPNYYAARGGTAVSAQGPLLTVVVGASKHAAYEFDCYIKATASLNGEKIGTIALVAGPLG